MIGICFSVSGIIFLSIFIICFFSKSTIKSNETKIYGLLLVTTFCGTFIDIFSFILFKIGISTETYLYMFCAKFMLIYFIAWVLIFARYVYSIAKNTIIKMQTPYFRLLFVIFSLIAFTREIKFIRTDNAIYPSGFGVNFTYFVVGIFLTISLVLTMRNISKSNFKKFVPIFMVIIMLTLATIIQRILPDSFLINFSLVVVVSVMYFTIENPDVKMIKEIHDAKVISDNANYEKTMFLYDMTNEIRGITKEINTETNDILTETKNEEVNIENINESARNIKSSTGKFTALTNEILDIDRIDSASIKVYNEKYSIKLILKELVSTYKKKCNGKGIDFRTSIVSDLPEYLYGDAIGFKNVLISLLDNSIKYTNKGYIELNVNMIKKQDICRLIITIEDSGVGIKSNDLEKIFKKDREYFNYNRSNLKNNLYNAKKLITLMGGTIIATSTYGKGTNMKIVLDQKEVIMEKNDYTKVYDKKKILLVDEGEYTEKILRKYLHNTGVEIDSVKLGKNCLDKIRDKERYDLILIDENISPISSIELMHKLKEVRNFNIPCILLTRNYGIEYSCYYVDQGFSDYLFKPIDKNALLNKINKF